jgi:signal transduction histidine kinase
LRCAPVAADLREVIHEALAELQTQAEAQGVALVCDCAAPLPGLRFDRHRMHGVFVNLLENALQHTPAGGTVRIQLTASPEAPAHLQLPSHLQLEVSDTGCGIAPENLGRVFEPFFTTRAKGTGLGLAITRKTIHDHGGTIEAASEPGRGTRILIRLPIGQS